MSSASDPRTSSSSIPHRCLARAVADALVADRRIEAVDIDRGGRRISVATLGQEDAQAVESRLKGVLADAEASTETRGGEEPCGLLAGHPNCDCCGSASSLSGSGLNIACEADRLTISRPTCPTARGFWKWRDIPWPRIEPREVELPDEEHSPDEWKWQLAAAALCGLFGIGGWALGERSLAHAMHVAAYVAGAWFVVEEVWERLRERVLDVHFLMLAVAAGSAAIGQWNEGVVLLFLFSLSGALEHYALGRTQREIRALFRAAPKEAVVLDPDLGETTVAVEALRPGQRLLIRPGSQFPVDAELARGRTAADESNLTGEATPVEKTVGDSLLAGTINLWGSVEATVLRPAQESALQKIVKLIREAQHMKAPSQRLTDRFGSRYTYGILLLTLVMFLVWWQGFGLPALASTEAVSSAFYRAMTLLVVASPCALVLSIPSAVLAAIAWGARRGILFRGGAAVENLAETGVVALDKTGTLTTGELRVAGVESFPPGREEEVAQLAFALERLSDHPLARAITLHGKHAGWKPFEVEQFESVTGLGLRAVHEGKTVLLGRREWLAEMLAEDPGTTSVGSVLRGGDGMDSVHSEVWVSCGELLGRVVLEDEIREQSAGVVRDLRQLGLRTLVLTGDRAEAAQGLQRALELDEVRSGLKPEQKVRAVVELGEQGHKVAMVGDGVNDAPSLAAAHVGVAMGARGSDAAMEQADIVLMHDRLENFLAAFRLSQRARRVIRQNLVISLGTVVVLVGFALFGAVPLTIGVLGHEGSTVVVVMNSLRLILGRWKDE
ncbi:MAG: heavy metal translocating P-type ATPase [Verrucomicrobiales bacterium]|nr:heavy metal translocating P-type ATPase [Verrucomicrobiales bacterium]